MKHSIFTFMLLPLLLTINTFCMEQEGAKQSEEIRKEEAAKFARQQEKEKKEAAHKKKKKIKEEEPEVEPGKGKEEEEESVIPAESTQAEQAKPFSEIWKKNISTYRSRLQQELKKRETVMAKPPASLIKFLEDNKDTLGADNVDEALLEQVISWINNNQINVNERRPAGILPTLLEHMITDNINSRIFYALLRNPATQISYDYRDRLNFGPNMRDILSARLLFTPFALAQGGKQGILSRYIDYSWGNTVDTALLNSGISRGDIQREIIELEKAFNQDKDIQYLTETRNLSLIRVILWFGTYTSAKALNVHMIERLKDRDETFTGNEASADGTTALMFAVGGGYLELVRELLGRGANPFLVNRYGDDAFSVVEIQLQRTAQDPELHQIYQQINQLLDPYAQQQAKNIGRAIAFLILTRVVEDPPGTRHMIHGLSYELAIPIAMGDLTTRQQQLILRYLEQLTPQELAALRAEMLTPTPTVFERLRNYFLSTGAVTALSYYLGRGSNP